MYKVNNENEKSNSQMVRGAFANISNSQAANDEDQNWLDMSDTLSMFALNL